MTRALSGAMASALAADVTQPGYLVSIAFATPVYLSSRGDVTWNGRVWIAFPVRVSNVEFDGRGRQTARIELGNLDNTMGALVMRDGTNNRAIEVFVCYASALGESDPVQVFRGFGNGSTVTPARVTVDAESGARSKVPRRYVTRETGFNFITPAGTVISWGGELYTLRRDG